ncbi:hypothetical protein ACC702_32390 [Rhizobium ruizarguesonis]
MMVPYPELSLGWLMPRHVDWLTASGVPMTAIIRPEPIRLCHGFRAADARLEIDANGPVWFAFIEPEDIVFWEPRSGALATLNGRAFALGERHIDAASTYSFGHCLNIFSNPLDWLRAGRDGCVVLNWRSSAFDRLRYCPRIAIAKCLLPVYDRHMQPVLPELFVLRKRQETAA